MDGSTAERRLILLSAGIAARRRAAAADAEQLIEEVVWSRLVETLRHRKLLPLLGPRIVDLAQERADAEFVSAVEGALEGARRQGIILQLVSQRIALMLGDAGISSLALKGPQLSEAIYRDPGKRISADVDLLVAPEYLQTAVEVVRELGYGAPSDYVHASGLPELHFLLVHETGKLPPVELHWRIHWYEGEFARERLLPPTPHSSPDWRPARADELISLLLFYARDGFIDLPLATDIGAWWDAFGAELQPGALEESLDLYPALARVVRVAAMVAEDLVGLPTRELFDQMQPPGVRERIARRMANPHPHGSRSQLYADMGLIDGLLAPPRGLRAFIRRQMLPPSEVLDQQARHGGKVRPRSAAGRCAGMLARYSVTMTRLMRAPQGLR